MRIQRAWTLTVLTNAALLLTCSQASAQYQSFYPTAGAPGISSAGAGAYSASPYPPGMSAAQPAAYTAPVYGGGYQPMPPVSAQAFAHEGPPARGLLTSEVFAQEEVPYDGGEIYGGDEYDGGYEYGYGDDGDGYCEYGCEGGCESCAADGPHHPGPYGDYQCGPRWYDFSVEYVLLTRDDRAGFQEIARLGLNSNNTVLSTDDLEFGEASGVRATYRYDLGAASNVEASYLGGFSYQANAQAVSNNDNLYSVFSNFGANSPTGVPGGFLQTDQAFLNEIEYSSNLHNVEVSFRHHWILPGQRIHGSWLMGVRYTKLNEKFTNNIDVQQHIDPLSGLPRGPASFDYAVNTDNDLIGYQIGGDSYACVFPGFMLGGEVKAGIFGNRAQQETVIAATNLNPSVHEEDAESRVSFVGEASLTGVYQISPGLSLRAGYTLLYIDGVALAPDNFNTAPPFVNPGPPRTVFIDSDGDVFYHGFTAGFEYMW